MKKDINKKWNKKDKKINKNLLKQLHKSNERAYNINIETRERENKKIRGVGNGS